MQFGDFLGNDRLKDRLAAAFRKGSVSHCFLISGPKGSGKHTLARYLAAALECTGNEKPCLHCTPCRKVQQDIHPDVIVVDDPERRTVPIDCIRSARADAMIRPNEGQKKVYIIPRASDLLAPAQNALLKIIEEPPPYGVFLLLAENPDALLPTVRSRCVELALSPLPRNTLIAELSRRCPNAAQDAVSAAADASGGWLGQALELLEGSALPESTIRFAEAYASADALALLQATTAMEKWKRPELEQELQRLYELMARALAARDGVSAPNLTVQQLSQRRTPADLLRAAETLRLALDYSAANVGVSLICGLLSVKLR